MLVWLAMSVAMSAPEVVDWTPDREARGVLVVRTPGLRPAATEPLIRKLVRAGYDVEELAWGCGQLTVAAAAEDLRSALAERPDVALVVHGLGAWLMTLAGDPHPRRRVLLGPVVVAPSAPLVAVLADVPVTTSVNLDSPASWRGYDVAAALVGDGRLLGCLPAELAVELQREVLSSSDLPDPPAGETWVIVSLGDAFAAVEDVVPRWAGRPSTRVVRVGVNAFQASDPSHLGLLSAPGAARAVERALRAPSRSFRQNHR